MHEAKVVQEPGQAVHQAERVSLVKETSSRMQLECSTEILQNYGSLHGEFQHVSNRWNGSFD